mmetsp:Transcript_10638/g.25605  ORF Transcript_10638/g.25605 Transcript_10638/m.25605 type:complete len:224 (-) Transcript_10638:349-1020(-)|eukprot:CAMPEP_0197184852 /NCGR_PEP_ID=MMETSP1423-20130617/10715_1 /TAXON_ID=476441 /ORGANISM="Pseudo-nitzschia heimii, Strain UNC1101" /LENGTH=223 /DNA_ID=CAMNT_0042635777 /DNA_START=51 /DNA_END=725 /DNA_ORIENTATION=-
MEVLTDSKSSTPVLLPNAKLMELLKKDVVSNKKRLKKESRKQKGRKMKNKFEHRDWIQEHVLEYLKGTPCVNIPVSKLEELKLKCTSKGLSSSLSPTKKKCRTLSDSSPSQKVDLQSKSPSPDYGLTEAEAIQILNFMPQEPVEIHLMVDDLHERMSESKQEEFLGMIRSYNTSIEKSDEPDSTNGQMQSEEIVDDSIEMLEKAGNHALNDDGDTDMKIKEEI